MSGRFSLLLKQLPLCVDNSDTEGALRILSELAARLVSGLDSQRDDIVAFAKGNRESQEKLLLDNTGQLEKLSARTEDLAASLETLKTLYLCLSARADGLDVDSPEDNAADDNGGKPIGV